MDGAKAGLTLSGPSSVFVCWSGTKKRLVIGMVGLPARGKTYLAKKLCRYLNWIGYNSAVFNIGSYRRKEVGSQIPATFFDPSNPAGLARRTELAQHALADMFTFLGGTGQAAIYDGTNSTVERRQMVREYIRAKEQELDIQVQLVWIEMVCTDPTVVSENIREAKLTSPDSAGLNADQAVENFVQRIKEYEKKYEELGSDPSENDQSYMRNIDCGCRVINNRIEGYLMSKIAFFVMNLKINRAPIYITRHGESQHNVKGLIGGDPYLSPNGVKYAEALASFIASEKEITRDELEELSVWTSTLKRTLQTAEHLRPLHLPATHWRALIEIQVGSCDNMTYEEIAEKMPEEFAARKKDKLNYRYPQGGESYMDVIQRIEPCILELERMSTPVLLVVHRAVARCFYSYFLGQNNTGGKCTRCRMLRMSGSAGTDNFSRFVCPSSSSSSDLPPSEIPHLDIPLHTVLKLVPKAYSCEVTRFKLGVDSCEDHTAASPQPSAEEQQATAARADEAAARAAAQGALAVATSTAQHEQSKETVIHITPTANQKSAKL